MEKENPYLNLYLGPLKKPWADYCGSLGKRPGAAIKEGIEHQLKRAGKLGSSKTYQQMKETPDDDPKVRFEILLTKSERAAVLERSDLEVCSSRRWIVDGIRASLTNEPQFSMKEIEVLGESNYQLLAIGRNLNQIAKVMNEGRQDSVTIMEIEQLREYIDTHTEKVSGAIRASLERWKIK
jgi:hypothetical protein